MSEQNQHDSAYDDAYEAFDQPGDYGDGYAEDDGYDPGNPEDGFHTAPAAPSHAAADASVGRKAGRAKGVGFPLFLGLVGAVALYAVYREGSRAFGERGTTNISAVMSNPDGNDDLSAGMGIVMRGGGGMQASTRTVDPTLVNNIYNQSRRLVAYAEQLGPPRAGEWRHMAQETPQSYYQFARDPQRPILSPTARTVVVQPFGDMSPNGRRLLPLVGEFLSMYFDLPARVVSSLPTSSIPSPAWHRKNGGYQLNAEYTLANILAPRLPSDGAIILGLTGADLYPGDRWTFENAFGWSSFYGRTALVSLARSFPGNDRREANMQDFVHILKFSVHEAAHAFGLRHCQRYACLVNGRCSLDENARKPLWLCPDCYAKLALATGFDPVRRARRLAEFCDRQGMTEESNYWRRVQATMSAR